MATRHLLVGVASTMCVSMPLLLAPTAIAGVHPSAPAPGPVTRAVRLETRPDVATAFGSDVAGFRIRGASSLSAMATEQLGPITEVIARRIGRRVYYRAEDVDLYAVPSEIETGTTSASHSVIAVPRFAVVASDGSVSPPPAPATGLIDPTFSQTWGHENVLRWVRYNTDDGGFSCNETAGEIRGQWVYARLTNVAASSPYDYWGVAQRSLASITKRDLMCDSTIDMFRTKMQSRTKGALAIDQDPLSQGPGPCVDRTFAVGATIGRVSVSISQSARKCEIWMITGALALKASEWYGVEYDNGRVWNRFPRESGAVAVIRVPRGASHGLNTLLNLDVDTRRWSVIG